MTVNGIHDHWSADLTVSPCEHEEHVFVACEQFMSMSLSCFAGEREEDLAAISLSLSFPLVMM